MDWLKPTEEGDMSFWASVCAIHPWHWIIQSGSFHSGLSSSPRKYKQVLGQPPPTTALMNVTYSIVDIAMILVMIMIYHDLHCECKWFWLFWLPWLSFFLTIANLPGWVTTSCNLNPSPFRRVPWRMGLMCLSKPSTMERSSVGGGEQIYSLIGIAFWVGSKSRKICWFFPEKWLKNSTEIWMFSKIVVSPNHPF